MSETPSSGPRPAVVALGGGHGLAASLAALRRVTDRLTAVVTVADDGGSSGRLRRDFGVLPPGDLRMAFAALCGDDERGLAWGSLVQHRFHGAGHLAGHTVGNLLLVALWELAEDPVQGLDRAAELLGTAGRVLPMSTVPLDIEATVEGPTGERSAVRGQVAVATTSGRIVDVALIPPRPPACAEAVDAIRAADWVVLGPGSWFTSVIPHLLVPDLADAITSTAAARAIVLNLQPQVGETSGFTPDAYLETLHDQTPGLAVDVVLADRSLVAEKATLRRAARDLGAELVVADLHMVGDPARHDAARLADVFARILDAPRPPSAARE